jgi:hypothetical protein
MEQVAKSSYDVISVSDSNFQPIIRSARPMKCSVIESSKVMDHPIETGATVTDYRIKHPIEVQLSVILTPKEYRDTYQQIREIFSRGELVNIETRTYSYGQLLLVSLPHEETADMFDTVAMALTFREVKFVTPKFVTINVANPKNANTVKRGQQQPKAAEIPEKKKQSVLGSFFSAIRGKS